MPLTSEQGYRIREEYSNVKEKSICDAHGLYHRGGSRSKIDGENETTRKSIKNASGSSTQVHLTTQKHFIEVLDLPHNAAEFVKHFCGSEDYNYQGRDRRNCKEIKSKYVEEFKSFLNKNKERVIDLIIRNGFDITHVVYRDIKNDIEYELTYDQIIGIIKKAEWKILNGGIHLKLNGKTLFHFQREGKKRKSNRYNVLWHIHRNLFQ
jgi:hypothetical protein